MKKQYSINRIVTATLVLAITLSLVVIYIFQVFFIDDFYKANKIKEMNEITENIKNSIYNNTLVETLKDVSVSNEFCIRIDTNSHALTGYGENNVCALKYLNDVQINIMYRETADNGGSKLYENYNFKQSGINKNDIFIKTQIIDYFGTDMLIMVSSFAQPLTPMIKTIESQFIFIVIVTVLITLLIAYLLSKIIIKPIVDMNNEAMKIVEGKYDSSNIKTSAKEVNDLNETLNKAQELIKVSDKARKELLSNVSHDLRTPLTMIAGYGEMMKDFKDEVNDENLDIIINEAHRLSDLVNDLLDLSKSELGELKLNLEETDIDKLIDEVAKQYEGYLKQHNINFIYSSKTNAKVMTDKKRLMQVLYNFINNAMNYNDKDERLIKLQAEDKDEMIEISVYDNGNGISKEDIDKIWDRYYKVDKEHKRQMNGSGIGLSLCKAILDALKIEHKVESKEGEYTRFTIYLKKL